VADHEAVLVGQLEVLLDLPLRVNDSRLAGVGDQVLRATEVVVKDLAKEHHFSDQFRPESIDPNLPATLDRYRASRDSRRDQRSVEWPRSPLVLPAAECPRTGHHRIL
jgi:hypothetical protein